MSPETNVTFKVAFSDSKRLSVGLHERLPVSQKSCLKNRVIFCLELHSSGRKIHLNIFLGVIKVAKVPILQPMTNLLGN